MSSGTERWWLQSASIRNQCLRWGRELYRDMRGDNLRQHFFVLF
ncbi:MAG: hypothetical protein ACOVRM_10755 [Planctomycetaceae bacterium]|jgi:hypothetical protein